MLGGGRLLCSGKGRQELPGTPAEAVHPLRIFGGPRRDDGRGGRSVGKIYFSTFLDEKSLRNVEHLQLVGAHFETREGKSEWRSTFLDENR